MLGGHPFHVGKIDYFDSGMLGGNLCHDVGTVYDFRSGVMAGNSFLDLGKVYGHDTVRSNTTRHNTIRCARMDVVIHFKLSK